MTILQQQQQQFAICANCASRCCSDCGEHQVPYADSARRRILFLYQHQHIIMNWSWTNERVLCIVSYRTNRTELRTRAATESRKELMFNSREVLNESKQNWMSVVRIGSERTCHIPRRGVPVKLKLRTSAYAFSNALCRFESVLCQT